MEAEAQIDIPYTSKLSIKLSAEFSSVMGEAIPSESPHKMRIMIVGDSISHGSEGDHTWRYRLWEWLHPRSAAATAKFEFVGPFLGTVPPEQPHPPQPPRFANEKEPPERDLTTGGYAKDVSPDFESRHFSTSGRQVFQVKSTIAEQVRLHNPDMLLVMLGFNDLGWCVSGPEGTLENMMELIANARSVRPNLKFLVANVLQRSPLSGHPELPNWTTRYNTMLKTAIRNETSESSQIELVDIEQNYGNVPDQCEGTFDGLHPNSLGEYQIARAFSMTLHRVYKIGDEILQIPYHIPARPIHVPRNVRACGVPYGIRFAFDAVYGARGYDVRQRSGGESGTWTEGYQGSNQIDNSFTGAGVKWEFQVRARGGDKEEDKSEWSPIVSALAHRETAPAPRSTGVYSTSTGFEITWQPLDGGWIVERYAVLWQDKTVGGFLCAQGARGTAARVDKLDAGHRYEVWLQTWTSVGPGVPASVGVLVVGSGVFSRPKAVAGKSSVTMQSPCDRDTEEVTGLVFD